MANLPKNVLVFLRPLIAKLFHKASATVFYIRSTLLRTKVHFSFPLLLSLSYKNYTTKSTARIIQAALYGANQVSILVIYTSRLYRNSIKYPLYLRFITNHLILRSFKVLHYRYQLSERAYVLHPQILAFLHL